MKMLDFLCPKAISADLKATDKEGVIRELIDLLIKAEKVKDKDKEKIVKILLERELLGSTGIGQGVGIPHGKSDNIEELVGAFGLSKKGVNFDSLDGEPVYIFFLLLSRRESAGPHLKGLARISKLLKEKYFRETLKEAQNEKEILKIIKDEDQKQH